MAALLYTTTQAVRASLGVSDIELTDVQITDLGVVSQLTLDLVEVFPDHATLAAIPEQDRTAEETLNFIRLGLYSQYQVAVYLLPAIQLWAVQKLSDGDAEQTRFMPANLQDTIDRITGLRDKYAGQLNPDLVINGAAFNVFTLVQPAYDPVTNT